MRFFKNKLFIFLLLAFSLFTGCLQTDNVPKTYPLGNLSVYFLDVGQADSAFIETDGKTMLIDGGNVEDSNLIYSFLKRQGVEKLDYIIASHAHEDHMGGLNAAIKNFEVGKIYIPEKKNDSKFYKTFEKLTGEKSIDIINPKTNDFFMLSECRVELFTPSYTDTDEINNTSIFAKLTYGDVSFLFTGDGEYEEEKDIINQGVNLKANVLKVGHHGSDTSSSYEFLRCVMPDISIISVGKDNPYGHPSEKTISKLGDLGSDIYLTKDFGDIKITTDGKTIDVQTSKDKKFEEKTPKDEKNALIKDDSISNQSTITYIGNINSKKLHRESCNYLPKDKNRIYFSSFDTAINDGYTPCSNCMN